ncbi:predicted protein [Chaetoceros tenuissimus]|uniref:Uncharacterized protein n=1 Tax=Chaetoceros tenuissimus TaxID=426638 RepID=A0AAD3D425_9STRA|nr:predicted protein [Chaetoceros tenuissimus]
MTLIQEYQQLKLNYNASSSKKHQFEKNDSKWQHNTTPSPSTETNTFSVPNATTTSKLQYEIEQFIQTLPVPAKDEKKLKQMISDMVTEYQSCIRCLQEDSKSSKAILEHKNEMHQDAILELQNKTDKVEDEKKILMEKMKKLKQEKEALNLEYKVLEEKSREDQEDIQSKHKLQMDDFLSTVEAKVESFKDEMDRKRDLLEKGYRDQITTLEKQLRDLEKDHDRQRDMDKQQQKSEIQTLFQRKMDQLTREKRELRKQLDCKAKEVTVIETTYKDQIQEMKQELLDQQIKHEQELQSIESKVKSLLSSRDKELSDAVERALNAEKRVFAFENCITEIESGLD